MEITHLFPLQKIKMEDFLLVTRLEGHGVLDVGYPSFLSHESMWKVRHFLLRNIFYVDFD